MSQVSSEIGQDGKTWSVNATLLPAGINDPEKQLSDDEIIAFKAKIQEADPWLIGRIATHIVTKTRKEDYEHDVVEAKAKGEVVLPFIGENGEFPTPDSYAKWVGHLSVDWALCLREAVDLPGADWPEHRATAATFAEALKEVEALEPEDG